MFVTLDRYASLETCKRYLGSSKKIRDASVLMHKEDVSKFEESHENNTRSFSMLYAGGLLSKRKYSKSRSDLGTYSMGTITTKGYLQGEILSSSGGIPIPKILSYKYLMFKVNNIDIGELLPVSDFLSCDLPPDER